MKQTNFTKAIETYKRGTYTNYSSAKDMDLYVRGRDKDGDNEVTSVRKITYGTIRLCNYGHIQPVIKDNLIKDLCYGLNHNEEALKRFVATVGTNVDLESYDEKYLEKLVNLFSEKDAHRNETRQTATVREKVGDSGLLFRENGGDVMVNFMPTRAHHRASSIYQVTELTPDGRTITKVLNPAEFKALGKIAKSSDWVSNRFSKDSSYVALAERGIIKDNNGPAETLIFKMKLKNLTGLNGISDDESDE